jgi:SOS-response transcriptional repressor LexA
MTTFAVGDKVVVKGTKGIAIGEVVAIDPDDDEFPIEVTFPNEDGDITEIFAPEKLEKR